MSVADAEVLTWCEHLGLDRVSDVRELRTGRSGSLVASVASSSGRAVVKVTTARARLDRARHEVEVLQLLGRHPVPLAPALLAAASTADGVAVALEEAMPLVDAHTLSTSDWRDLAGAIAEVHLVAVPATLGLGTRPGPARPLPAVLEHGDCHLDNIVLDAAGRILLVDWQEARLGDGLADLVFVWQRAEFAGAHPPREAMTATYADTRGLDRASLAPLLDRTELRLLEEAWHPFLPLGDDSGRAAMSRRLAALTSDGPGPTLPT